MTRHPSFALVAILLFLLASLAACRSDEEAAALVTMEKALVRAEECVEVLREHGGDMKATLKALAVVRRRHFDAIFEFRRIGTTTQKRLSPADGERVTQRLSALHSEARDLLGKYNEEERKDLAFTLSTLQ